MLGAWSVPEGLLGDALRSAGAPPFEQNVVFRDRRGQRLVIVDAWWASLRAALEVDGAEHHSSGADWADTLRRTGRLEESGIAVLHVPAIDVLRDAASVAQHVVRWLAALEHRTTGQLAG
ncbi:MAG: hypothetical protein JWN61_915 [Pseudonocardiales bacterium]|nr:hypothetical protein [Pseudonocardiales bacterium]